MAQPIRRGQHQVTVSAAGDGAALAIGRPGARSPPLTRL